MWSHSIPIVHYRIYKLNIIVIELSKLVILYFLYIYCISVWKIYIRKIVLKLWNKFNEYKIKHLFDLKHEYLGTIGIINHLNSLIDTINLNRLCIFNVFDVFL